MFFCFLQKTLQKSLSAGGKGPKPIVFGSRGLTPKPPIASGINDD